MASLSQLQSRMRSAQRRLQNDLRRLEQQSRRAERELNTIARQLRQEAEYGVFQITCSCGYEGQRKTRWSNPPKQCPRCGAEIVNL